MAYQGQLPWEEMSEKELAIIKLKCEKSFMFFHRIFFNLVNDGKWDERWYHVLMAKEINEVVNAKNKTESLIINVPPGSGKTHIFSVSLPVWSHIKSRKLRNLNISYSNELVESNLEQANRIIAHPLFQKLWPSVFRKRKANETHIGTEEKLKTEFVSRSMFGQITGKRGGHYEDTEFTGMVTLDDPDKPEDMHSKVKRKKQHRVLTGTIKSRRAIDSDDYKTPIIVIQQRLHELDTTGFLLSGGKGGRSGFGSEFKYRHVVIPALINQEYIDSIEDEHIRQRCIDEVCHTEQIDGYWSFFPGKESVKSLFDLWEDDEYTFMSQYMQRPIKVGGNIFNPDYWVYYGEVMYERDDETGEATDVRDERGADLVTPPNFKFRFVTADTASKTKEVNDFSVFCHWGFYKDRVYLIDMMRGKWEAADLKDEFAEFVQAAWDMNSHSNGSLTDILVEDKSSGTFLIQDSNELPIIPTAIQRNVDKLNRAHSVAPQIKKGRVVIPFGDKRMVTFVSEHSEFSADDTHAHDDIVDNVMDAVEFAILGSANLNSAEDFIEFAM